MLCWLFKNNWFSPIQESFTFAEMVAAVVLAQWHTNEAVWRKAEPRECNIVISDTEPESLLQYDVNGMRRHRSQPFMGFLDCRECYMRYSSSSRRRMKWRRRRRRWRRSCVMEYKSNSFPQHAVLPTVPQLADYHRISARPVQVLQKRKIAWKHRSLVNIFDFFCIICPTLKSCCQQWCALWSYLCLWLPPLCPHHISLSPPGQYNSSQYTNTVHQVAQFFCFDFPLALLKR